MQDLPFGIRDSVLALAGCFGISRRFDDIVINSLGLIRIIHYIIFNSYGTCNSVI